MKKILSLAILIILSTTGCKKEPKFCWKCTMYKLNSKGYLNTSNPILSTECDKTEKEIRAVEKTNTKTMEVFNGNNYQTNTVQSMSCQLNQ
ncbi:MULTISPECIES: hypothetical protein [unclassified Mucilaginibacter]|uniref:hypothetical protein n=1 Tax=unclassified Mucilaginibacter TaxID=2617802 RepID=UPI002AC8E2DB|nr:MULTISPECIES: hypothetical protein [unclassified Mucilaginibacter]MEB0262388.1 hypothetical protein [Mucilaginibacter sp. 10I4]MEB0277955.1 hypothetical protein [Mucilaginibacter sp. 10B2]MEB0299692.1 hypothetical protein [Mucilaginibacter sp. 5C4]WPX22846.1 hypothetical protein RHM67_16315 [Mucilaginibacter sp. 5C4]